MSDERLIEEVRQYTCLYDMSDCRYLDTRYKSTLWAKIAKHLKIDDQIAKKRWTNIRDQYKRSLNKQKTTSGQGATTQKKYRYADILTFLIPYFMDRGTISNITEDVTDSATAPSEHETLPEPEAVPSSAPQLWPSINLESEPGTSTDLRAPTRGSRTSARARRAQRPYHTANDLYKLIKDREPQKKPDQLDDFCVSLASTIRTFPPFLQNKAKGRLFSVVQEIELEHILGVSSPIRSTRSRTPNNLSVPHLEMSQEGLAGSPVEHISYEQDDEERLAGSPVRSSSPETSS